jgi:predicted Fe-Mo cluster-binding NifX family protein
MKLCITAAGNSLDAMTDESFGRAPWLVIVDTDTQALVEAVENSGVQASQGAGIAAAQAVADRGVQALLTGRVGPKAQAALQAAGIQIYENINRATVRQVLEEFNSGRYSVSTGASSGYGAGCGPGKGRGQGGRGGGRGMGRRGGR